MSLGSNGVESRIRTDRFPERNRLHFRIPVENHDLVEDGQATN